MQTFKIPVVWQMMGYREVEAESLDDACKVVMEDGAPLPEGNYLDESFGLDKDGVDSMVFDVVEQPAGQVIMLQKVNALPEEYWK